MSEANRGSETLPQLAGEDASFAEASEHARLRYIDAAVDKETASPFFTN